MKLEFSNRISKNTEISNSMKIRLVETELFHADRPTDRGTDMKQTVAFRNFANAPKNSHVENDKYAGSNKYSPNNSQKHPTSNIRTLGRSIVTNPVHTSQTTAVSIVRQIY
jgi:hypothetical protein